MCFMPVADPKTVKNRVHLDLTSSAADRDQEIDRLLALGTRRVDIGQTGAESWTVLADPEGNEFCVVRTKESLILLGSAPRTADRPCPRQKRMEKTSPVVPACWVDRQLPLARVGPEPAAQLVIREQRRLVVVVKFVSGTCDKFPGLG